MKVYVLIVDVENSDGIGLWVFEHSEDAKRQALEDAQAHWKLEFDGEDEVPKRPETYEDLEEYECESSDCYKLWKHQILKQEVIE